VAPSPIILRYHLATLCIKGLTSRGENSIKRFGLLWATPWRCSRRRLSTSAAWPQSTSTRENWPWSITDVQTQPPTVYNSPTQTILGYRPTYLSVESFLHTKRCRPNETSQKQLDRRQSERQLRSWSEVSEWRRQTSVVGQLLRYFAALFDGAVCQSDQDFVQPVVWFTLRKVERKHKQCWTVKNLIYRVYSPPSAPICRIISNACHKVKKVPAELNNNLQEAYSLSLHDIWRAEMHHHAKFHLNRSMRCGNIMIFRFSR